MNPALLPKCAFAFSTLALLACGRSAPLTPDGAAGAASGDAGTAGGDAGAAGSSGGSALADASPDDPAATNVRLDGATLPDGNCVENAFKHADGVCACQPDVPTVCGSSCTDVTSDDDNCGACGHVCAPTSACNGGVCGPSVVNVVPAAPGCLEIDLAVSASTLYWTDRAHGTVMSQPFTTRNTPSLIATNETSPSLIAVGADDVFWVDVVSQTPAAADAGDLRPTTTATIRARKIAGGMARDLSTETDLTGGVRGLVASEDGQTLYYSAGTAIRAVPVAGGSAFDVGHEDEGDSPTALALQANLIAFTVDLTGILDVITVVPGAVAVCAAPDPASTPAAPTMIDTNCTRAVRGGPELLQNGIVLRSDGVYWAQTNEVEVHQPSGGGTLAANGTSTDSVFTGSANQVAWTASEDDVAVLAGGPDALYFGSDDTIEKAPYAASGTVATIIARGQKMPSSMAVGATAVYWASPTDCAINSVAK